MKDLIVFDLDGTIAECKSSLDAEMTIQPKKQGLFLFRSGIPTKRNGLSKQSLLV